MGDLAARGAPLEYWFFRTEVDDLRLLVDLIAREPDATVETRVALTVGDEPVVTHDVRPAGSAVSDGVRHESAWITSTRTEGDSGGVQWSLDIELGEHRIQPVSDLLASAGALDMVLLSRPTARFTGEVHAGGRSWALDGAPGMVSHYWGKRLAPSWAWVSVVGPPGSPRLEATVLRSRLWGSRVTTRGGYLWSWSGRDDEQPVMMSMPSNGALLRWAERDGRLHVHGRRGTRSLAFSASAAPTSYADFGEGIRNSQRATVRLAGADLPASLEFRRS